MTMTTFIVALSMLLLNHNISQAFVSPSVRPAMTELFANHHHHHHQQQQHDDNDDNHNNNNNNNNNNLLDQAKNLVGVALTSSLIWASPALLVGSGLFMQSSSSPPPLPLQVVALAKEKASGSGSRVNKDADSLLRYGLPITNKEVRQLQSTIETINIDLGSKRKAAALDGVKKTKSQLTQKSSSMTKACRSDVNCDQIIADMDGPLSDLAAGIAASQDAFTGSEQERTALDKAYAAQQKVASLLTKLQEAMVPAGYKTTVPSDYNDLPQLQGRATVEFVLKKGANAESNQFDVNGVNYPEAKMTMIIDGYVAPVTGGNFVELVQKGFYNNMAIQRSDGFVVQTGDPEGEAVGYVATPSKSVGAGPKGERLIPLEIMLSKDYPGEEGALYETTIDDDGRGGEATVLPFSSYGAMGWAREEYSPNSGSSQFFWLLFDSDLTPAGKNLLDGNYPW